MATSAPRDHDTTERVDRNERDRIIERPVSSTPAASNVNVAPTTAPVVRNDPVWTVTRVVTLVFTVLEVLLLLAANPEQSRPRRRGAISLTAGCDLAAVLEGRA